MDDWIKIKAAGPRGWARVHRRQFDPSRHVRWTELQAAPLTREDIRRMPRDDVADLLMMHGIDPDPHAKLGEMRGLARKVVFADL